MGGEKVKIGILGAGNIGGSLGRAWAAKGHEVIFGVRDVNSAKTQTALNAVGANARAGTFVQAAAFGQVVVLAVPWAAVKETLAQCPEWRGKILIDTTNRIRPPEPAEAPSAAETVARWAHGARVVKAFNALPWEAIRDPQFGSDRASIFVCGDDEASKAIVMQLVADAGLDAVEAGPLANALWVEGMTKMWLHIARTQGRNSAFRLLRR